MRPSTITQDGTGISAWLPVDMNILPSNIGYAAVITGAPTYDIEYTYDDIFNPNVTPTAFKAQTGKTANQDGNIVQPIRAMRINQTAGVAGNKTTLTVLQGLKG